MRRYLDLAFLLVVSLLICALFQPLLNYVGNWFCQNIGRWHPWIQASIISLITGALWFILIRLGGFPWRNLWLFRSWRYLPTWCCGIIGTLLYIWLSLPLWAVPESEFPPLKEISSALPISFGFFCDLYCHWLPRESSGVLDLAVTEAMKIYEGSKDTFIAALQYNQIDRIFNFVTNRMSGRDFNPDEWQWLANLLLRTVKKNRQVILPQIVPFMFKYAECAPQGNTKIEPNGELSPLFDNKKREVMEILAQEIDLEDFRENDKRLIEFAQSEARKWLAENP
ncbi:MAG TPA: hypothetical protein PLY86_22440 [bacterium]|nr:hypothetical protein [bacterium]